MNIVGKLKQHGSCGSIRKLMNLAASKLQRSHNLWWVRNADQLIKRVLEPIQNLGMRYRSLALINQHELGKNIYCHFILETIR